MNHPKTMKNFIFIIFILLLLHELKAQSVTLGEDYLDLNSSDQGVRIPQMSTAKRDSIPNPPAGLQILNTDDFCLDVYTGSQWSKLCGQEESVGGKMPDRPDNTLNQWLFKTNYPNSQTAETYSFVIGRFAYIGMGYNYDNGTTNEFQRFDPLTSTWQSIAAFPGTFRSDAQVFTLNGKAYLYGGGYTNEVWQYDPEFDEWTQKGDFPGTARFFGSVFTLNNRAYLGPGLAGFEYQGPGLPVLDIPIKDLWEYNPVNDSWTQKSSFPGRQYYGMACFSLGNQGFMIDGEEDNEGIAGRAWMYDATLDQWIKISDPPFTSSSKGISLDGVGIILAGFEVAVWKYNAQQDSWLQIGTIPNFDRGLYTTFSIGKRLYAGLGLRNFDFPTDIYEFVLDNSIDTYKSVPTLPPNSKISDGIWTVDGKRVFLEPAPGQKVGIGTSNPSASLEVKGTLAATNWLEERRKSNDGFARMGPLLIQWGLVTYESNNTKTVKFPVSFEKLLSVTATVADNFNNTASNVPVKIVNSTNSVFEIGGTKVFSTGTNYPSVHWMAIGY